MMKDPCEPSDEPWRALLRGARPSPTLPLRFQEAVWRRIEGIQATHEPASLPEWLDRAAAWLLRPRLALAGVTAMLLVGAVLGVRQGDRLAHDLAKQQYLAAVSPLPTR